MEFDFAKIQAELESLNAGMPHKAEFNEEMDFAIMFAFENGKSRDEFAAWFKKKYGWGCRDTLNKRYKELTS